MTPIQDIYNFVSLHKAALSIAFLWATREWSTVGGWRGLQNYFLTGKITPPETTQPQNKT